VLQESCNPACDLVSEREREEEDPHQQSDEPWRRELRHYAHAGWIETDLSAGLEEVENDQPHRTDARVGGLVKMGTLQDEEVGHAEEPEADRELHRARRVVLAEVRPEPGENRRAGEDAERRDGLEPARRIGPTE